MIRPSRHNYAFDPSLISLDNEMEDFMAVRKGIVPCGEMPESPERTDEEKRKLWADAHMRFHFPDAKEAQFIQDVERMRAANPPKRFSWKVLGMLLLACVLAVLCAYLGLNGGEW